jgi:hypothetical protein
MLYTPLHCIIEEVLDFAFCSGYTQLVSRTQNILQPITDKSITSRQLSSMQGGRDELFF